MKKKLILGCLAAASISAPLSAQFISSLNGSIDLEDFGIYSGSGIVVEIKGLNGLHVAAQIAGTDLYNGFFDYGTGGGDFANTIFGYTGDALTPLPGVAGALGILGESYGWDAFDFGGGIMGINIEMTLFDFQGANNIGDDLLFVNGLDFLAGLDLGFIYTPSGTTQTASFIDGGSFFDPLLQELSLSGILNFSLFETNPDVLTFGGYTPVDFLTGANQRGNSIDPTIITPAIPEPSFIGLISFGFIGTLIATYRRRR